MNWNDGVAGKARLRSLGSFAVVVLLWMGEAHGQAVGEAGGSPANSATKATDLRGEWLRNGPGFACKVAAGRKLPPELLTPEVLARACQHIGPFVIGQDAKAVKAALGEPHRTLAGSNGQTQWIYFLGQRDHYPYLVVTTLNERIAVLQVTGPSAAQGYGFNRIDLGATSDALVAVFGQPNHVEPSELKDTELWAYGVWPFSFEVKAGHVTSIRISEP